ncbi:MAG TPA: hypothetical protein DDX71_06335 [Ruminococcus sp.]|nr:hypothetical protein [Ruminococcus sp.]
MGLFKKKQPEERNEIGNRELKENIGNAALGLLKEGEDYDNLAGLTLQFGYLFVIEGHGVEALFKIITDKATLYFAAQGNQLMRLDFNEALFQSTTAGFLDLHGGNAQ